MYGCPFGEWIGKERIRVDDAIESRSRADGINQGVDIVHRAAKERCRTLSVMTVCGAGDRGRNQRCILGAYQFVRLHLVGDAQTDVQ